ncbi:MAG: 2-oxoacid:acceptor oxidoreductase subunit alpha [Candidatus Heimdallarchaeota archaeon]
MSVKNEFIVRIGGAAGDGVASAGETFGKICSRLGLYVHGLNFYQSVIRGGLVGWNIRASSRPIKSQGQGIDILIALTTLAANTYGHELQPGGLLIYDEKKVKPKAEDLPKDINLCPLPLIETAKEFGRRMTILQNTVAIAAVLRVLNIESGHFNQLLREQFQKKGEEIIKINLGAAERGYQLGSGLPSFQHSVQFGGSPRMFISGNQAIGLGAMAAGLQYYAAYPMTPATSILHFLAAHAKEYGMVVKQVEDELGVVNSAIGASFAGTKSMCGTSGGGFALMTEAIGFAGMIETPLVVVTSMRGGPSTGLPTKTEQGDLNQVFGASQGDFPKAIFAPLNVTDAYDTIVEALNLAEKYQIPIIVMSDLYLSEHYETIEEVNLEPEIYERLAPNGLSDYLRYKSDTENGVSPRSIPGESGYEFIAGSDEHDEKGNLISDVRAGLPEQFVIRKQMMEKRGRKLEFLSRELRPPETYGPPNSEITIIGWGSSTGAIQEAVDILNSIGIRANSLHIRSIVPFNEDMFGNYLQNAKKVVMVEGNYSGQMKRHISAETSIKIDNSYNKYDGDYLSPKEIVNFVKQEVL